VALLIVCVVLLIVCSVLKIVLKQPKKTVTGNCCSFYSSVKAARI